MKYFFVSVARTNNSLKKKFRNFLYDMIADKCLKSIEDDDSERFQRLKNGKSVFFSN